MLKLNDPSSGGSWSYRLTHGITPDESLDIETSLSNHETINPALLSNQSALTVHTSSVTSNYRAIGKYFNGLSEKTIESMLRLGLLDNHIDNLHTGPHGSAGPHGSTGQDNRMDNYTLQKVNGSSIYYKNHHPGPWSERRLDNKSETEMTLNDINDCSNTTSTVSYKNMLNKQSRRPRKLPEIPPKVLKDTSPMSTSSEKSLAQELQEAEECSRFTFGEDDEDDVFIPPSHNFHTSPMTPTTPTPAHQRNKREHSSKSRHQSSSSQPEPRRDSSSSVLANRSLTDGVHVKFNTTSVNSKALQASHNLALTEDSLVSPRPSSLPLSSFNSARKQHGTEGHGNNHRKSSSSSVQTSFMDLEVTHRGMHHFIPRHPDEMELDTGDPLHVTTEADDLWCEGINLRTGLKGIFPAMYATNLDFLEEDSEDDGTLKRFSLRFLGSVEVNCNKGTSVLCHAIAKVAMSRRTSMNTTLPPLCTVEINDYGIRMIDKSKEGHEGDTFSHFFSLKNISFCGYHPRNERYFAFITKHPAQYRFACHVFLGDRACRSVSDAVGNAFKGFYKEYMAFTHPTEDIYME